MMMKTRALGIVTVAALTLSGCAGGPKETGGGLLGAAAGGLLGSQIGGGTGQLVATGVGAALGYMAGSAIGRELDAQDRALAERAYVQAMEYSPAGRASRWKNPDSGHYGEVTPTRTYQNENGENCREYRTTIYVGGRKETGFGKACRVGRDWRIVS